MLIDTSTTTETPEKTYFPPTQVKAKAKSQHSADNLLYDLNGLKVIHGDCVSEMGKLGPESVDVVVTSPPYNIGLKYSGYADSKPHAQYLSWLDEVAQAISSVLKKDGALFLNIGATNVDPLKPLEIAQVFQKYFKLQNNIIWVKSISLNDDSFGPFKPINSKRFLNNTFEYVFHFTKNCDVAIDRLAIGVPYKYKCNLKRFNHSVDKRCAGNIWYIPYKPASSKKDKFFHPCTYPVELAEKCILMHGLRPDLVVLDPFLGTASTLAAVKQLGCKGVGIELDKAYCLNSIERLEK
jgi:site-specific DNA-methyltransferase (adenine-specific)